MQQGRIADRITVQLALLLGGVSFILMVFTISVRFYESEKDFALALHSKLEFAASGLAEPFYTFNKAAMSNIAETIVFKGDNTVVQLEILDKEGTSVLRVVSPDYQDQNLSKISESRSFAVEEKNITYMDTEIGKVRMVSSRLQYRNALFQWIAVLVGFVILGSLATVYLIHQSLNFLLSRPLGQLLAEIQKLKSNDLTANMKGHYKFELSEISKAFNESTSELNRKDILLRKYMTNLEEIVEQRTNQLEEQKAKAVHSARLAALGEMSAGIAHEINNPLSVIGGSVYKVKSLLNKKGEGFGVELDSLSKITQMVKRIEKIVKGLRAYSRDGSADAMEYFSFKQLIEDVEVLAQHRVQSSGATLKFDIDPTIEKAFGQEVRLSQVIINLINNAADAIKDLNIEKWIELHASIKGQRIFVSVTDCGHGIPLEIRQKMMQAFFTTKQIGVGTGLGLSISRTIIAEHGGDLTYDENCPNTRFMFTVPLNEGEFSNYKKTLGIKDSSEGKQHGKAS
jgi:C4-dicarboxylate-specific signal transduction histidine kinase